VAVAVAIAMAMISFRLQPLLRLLRSTPSAPSPPPPVPPTAEAVNGRPRYTIAQRVHALAMMVEGFSGPYIQTKTGIVASAQSKIRKKALERGFQPEQFVKFTLQCTLNSGGRETRTLELCFAPMSRQIFERD
jgi:hypothetical protein